MDGSRKAAAKRLFGVNRALPWAVFGVPRWSFREHGPLQRLAAEKTRKANRRAAHTHVPPGYQGRGFSSRRGCRRGFAATSLSGLSRKSSRNSGGDSDR